MSTEDDHFDNDDDGDVVVVSQSLCNCDTVLNDDHLLINIIVNI